MASIPWHDQEFLGVLLRSASFWSLFGSWPAIVAYIAITVCLPAVIIATRRIGAMLQDVRGSASAIDLVLVTPVLVFVVTVMLQFGILMQSHMINHYAAFSAARSARVHYCPSFLLIVRGVWKESFDGWKVLNNLSKHFLSDSICTKEIDVAAKHAENAARLALVAASPSSPMISCQAECRFPDQAIRAMTNSSEASFHTPALVRQAQYAFDRDNVKVDIQLYKGLWDLLSRGYEIVESDLLPQIPITATVEYRQHLLLFIGRILGDAQRTDGSGLYYITLKAEVSLL